MMNLKLLPNWQCGLNLGLVTGSGPRHRQRRGKPPAQFAAEVMILEERCLLSPVEMPLAPKGSPGQYDTVAKLSDVLFVGNSTVGNVPVKQITLFNNTDHTIYPFLYDPNTGKSTSGGYYDPIDPHNEEYRGYIGYKVGNTDYLGLEINHSITINVPLVFWDSGRAAIATDPNDLLPKDTATSKASPITNPFFFFYKNLNRTNTARYVVNAAASTGGNGIVMYYHTSDAKAPVNPGADAPEQLLEFTIRDKPFLTKLSTPSNPIDPKQLITLINYDVSYVDHLLLPVAMEATAVPVPNTNVKQDYGWIGANQDFQGTDSLQAAIQTFTSNTSANGLGTYFQVNGKSVGWPTYFNPNYSSADTSAGLRIPGGANIIFGSPFAGVRSSFSKPFGPNNHWMLSSGGNGAIQYSLGGNFKAPNAAVMSPIAGIEKILGSLVPGMSVKADGVVVGQIKSVNVATRTVVFTQNLNIPNGKALTFDFFNPASDPYATRLTNLWYSWERFYVAQFKTFTPKQITANVSSDTDNGKNDYRVLTFGQTPHPELAVGMRVTGGGITALTTIVKITTVKNVQTVYLSAPVPGVKNPKQLTFTFSAPQPIAFENQTTDLHLKFPADQQLYAKAFAATVYEVLSVFSTAPRKVPALPGSMEVVGNSIGGNVGFLPTAEPVNYVNISADVRDLVKSALRGIPDFTTTPESKWYPAPSEPTGNQTFNAYNLDPYVWFIHRELGLSGYGFSFDDDTADVGANGTSTLSIAVGGLEGLSNKSPWAPNTQWGTVNSLATISQGTGPLAGKTIISLQNTTVYNQLSANDPANSVVGAYVSGNGIIPGTNLVATAIINQNQFVLSKNAPSSSKPILLTFTGKADAAPLLYNTESSPLNAVSSQNTVVTSTLLALDHDDKFWTGATVKISINYQKGQDQLLFENTAKIHGSWNPSTGTLTLSGVDTVSNYKIALLSVAYHNTSTTPNTSAIRTITFQSSDGDLLSDIVSRNVSVKASVPPVLSGFSGTVTYTENALPSAFASHLIVSNSAGGTLARATVTFTNWQAEDRVSFYNFFALQHSLTQDLSKHTATLTITGSATIDQYQTLLRSLTYADVSNNPITSVRTVNITVNDGGVSSNTVTRQIVVNAVNDAPVISNVETTALVYKANNPAFPPRPISSTLLLVDPDNTKLSKATVRISGGYQNNSGGHDLLTLVNQNGITGSFDASTGTLHLSGISSVSNYRNALRSITFSTSGSATSTAIRTLTITATDTASTPATSLPVTRTVTVST